MADYPKHDKSRVIGRMATTQPERKCAICELPGGRPMPETLHKLGYKVDLDKLVNVYAHDQCVISEQRRRADRRRWL